MSHDIYVVIYFDYYNKKLAVDYCSKEEVTNLKNSNFFESNIINIFDYADCIKNKI